MQSTVWFAAIGTGLLLGCTPVQKGLPYAPVFNTGVRATIISPGQNAPPMPGQRSSTSGSQGQTGFPGQPGGGPPLGTPPSAYGSAGELQSLGGAVTVDTREIEKPRNQQPGTREQAQQAYEQREVDSMERELAQRQHGAPATQGAAPVQVATTQTAGGGTLSIADELAALRSHGARSAPAPDIAPASAPVASAAAANGAKDRDGDGKPDQWAFESNGKKTRIAYDDDGDGRPDRTEYYDTDGKDVARVEQDTDGDGAPDSWVLNENGKISQRRADTNHDGQVDSWTFYDTSGLITRQAQDLDGDGTRDRAELFEHGKIARRTEDLDGDGQPDRITRFDAQGNQTELEEDKDGDGQIDVRSYYADGRLVKREILDASEAGATP
ncbi:MAG: hypothetical protein NTZ61_09135 [Proteobacteria bacterium]|nr:hypothetical protein [Pseudomonadota bacterium]